MRRYLESQLRKDLERKMVFVAGPRQVGKTTLAKIDRFIASRSVTIPDSDHIRCFRRAYLEFGTRANDVVTTLSPPSGGVKRDPAFRILDSSAAGRGRANRQAQGRHIGIDRLTVRD